MTPVLVRATYLAPDTSRPDGTVVFVPGGAGKNVDAQVVKGVLEAELDPDTEYTCHEHIAGAPKREFTFRTPTTADEYELADLL